MGEAGIDVELVAASLRASSRDLKTFVEVLAVKLDEALPDRVQVERRATRFLAKESASNGSSASLATCVIRSRPAMALRLGARKAVRGVVLKSEEMSLDHWSGALARDLAEEAQTNEQGSSLRCRSCCPASAAFAAEQMEEMTARYATLRRPSRLPRWQRSSVANCRFGLSSGWRSWAPAAGCSRAICL